MGGLIAQQFTIDRPDLVRKLILGTGPRSSGRCCRQIVSEQIFYKGIIG